MSNKAGDKETSSCFILEEIVDVTSSPSRIRWSDPVIIHLQGPPSRCSQSQSGPVESHVGRWFTSPSTPDKMEVWSRSFHLVTCPPLQAAALLNLFCGRSQSCSCLDRDWPDGVLLWSSSWFRLSFLCLLIPLSRGQIVCDRLSPASRFISSRMSWMEDGVCLFGPPLFLCQPEQPIRVISVPNDSLHHRTVWIILGRLGPRTFST